MENRQMDNTANQDNATQDSNEEKIPTSKDKISQPVKIIQTPTFGKQIKRLHANQKRDLDNAVMVIANDPLLGELKKGDLDFLRVYKFKMAKQLTLLGYSYQDEQLILTLITLGSHENFYRDVKKLV